MDSKIWYIPARNDRLEKNVGIYCRVSTKEKEQLYSLAAQISALTRAVANVSQWRLADVFIDIASAKAEVPQPKREYPFGTCYESGKRHIRTLQTKAVRLYQK